MNNETLDTIDGERSIPSVNEVSTARWKRGALGVAFAGTVAAFSGYVYLNLPDGLVETVQEPKQKDITTASTVPQRTFVLPKPEPKPEPKYVPVAAQPIVPVPKPSPRPLQSLPSPPPPKPTIDRSASRSAVAVDQTSNSIQVAQAQTGQAPGGLFGGAESSSDLGQSLQPTKLTATTASRLQDRNYMLTRGAFIDCVLTTKLVSTVPGMTSCNVTRDVFSSNGKVVLIEAGSKVTGEYKANLQQGMNRIFVLWSRVETPTGVVIDLNSPATDSLGASGLSGHVDNHFWQRFGGAMLLSLIDDAAQIAANRTNSNNENTQIVLSSAGSVSSELAAEVLRNTINIPPTLYANQGARIGIFVARDLDFSTVYNVQ